MGSRLLAIVAEGDRSRVYFAPTVQNEVSAAIDPPADIAATDLPDRALGFRVQQYGMTKWRHLFTNRQLFALAAISDLLSTVREHVQSDAKAAGVPDSSVHIRDGGVGATAYAEAITVYLAIALSKFTDYSSTICTWNTSNENIRNTFPRQAIPMTWDYAEASPLHGGLSFTSVSDTVANSLSLVPYQRVGGAAKQADCAARLGTRRTSIVQTDPPYFGNIGYADLSDYFYVWLRRSLGSIFPELFATLTTPKLAEIVATPYRHENKADAESFLRGRYDSRNEPPVKRVSSRLSAHNLLRI